MSNTTPVHISVVLDRSGSMASIADDIAGGFNTFLAKQREEEGAARITLVQFDGQDPFEVLIDGEGINTVSDLEGGRYLPRGNTPLYDAVGRMIARIDAEILKRADAGMPIEDQVVLVVTDGYENASTEFNGATIATLIEARKQRAWVFVFLGSDESTFAEGARMRVEPGNTARWMKSAQGSKQLFARMSTETADYRNKGRMERELKSKKFFEETDEDGEK